MGQTQEDLDYCFDTLDLENFAVDFVDNPLARPSCSVEELYSTGLDYVGTFVLSMDFDMLDCPVAEGTRPWPFDFLDGNSLAAGTAPDRLGTTDYLEHPLGCSRMDFVETTAEVAAFWHDLPGTGTGRMIQLVCSSAAGVRRLSRDPPLL